jgi:hypothetical protein
MSVFDNTLVILHAALASIPPSNTLPSALLAGAFGLPTSGPTQAPFISAVWSNKPTDLKIHLLLNIPLYPIEFYRDLEIETIHAWDNGLDLSQSYIPLCACPCGISHLQLNLFWLYRTRNNGVMPGHSCRHCWKNSLHRTFPMFYLQPLTFLIHLAMTWRSAGLSKLVVLCGFVLSNI